MTNNTITDNGVLELFEQFIRLSHKHTEAMLERKDGRYILDVTESAFLGFVGGIEQGKRIENAAMQAQIDRLMFEFCPERMTPEQIEEYGNNQKPHDKNKNKMPSRKEVLKKYYGKD